MTTKRSKWKFYVPDNGGDTDSAREIPLKPWHSYDFFDPDDAAQAAWEHVFSDAGDYRIGAGPDIVVISPTGEEFTFSTEAEASIDYTVTQKE